MTATLDTSELIAALLAEANRHANETADLMNSAAEALSATLRQQAGRVDEARVAISRMAGMLEQGEWADLLSTDPDVARVDAAISAALAQNTQGEAVASIPRYHMELKGTTSHWGLMPEQCDTGEWCKYEVVRRAEFFVRLAADLHAERARVPEDDELLEIARRVGLRSTMHAVAPSDAKPLLRLFVQQVLAAAPSQRGGGWVLRGARRADPPDRSRAA